MRQLEREALDIWATKPENDRMKRVGLFRKKQENIEARDLFVRDHVAKNYPSRLKRNITLL